MQDNTTAAETAENTIASIFMIDGVEAPTPSNFTPVYSDYDSDSAGRSETMVMNRDIIRTNLKSPKYEWKLQTPEMRKLLKLVQPEKITVRIYDLYAEAENPYTEYDCYCSTTRTVTLLKWNPADPEQSWWQIQLEFIEY